MGFPTHRMRRLRLNNTIRDMVRETSLSVNDFIYPLFVQPGAGKKDEIVSMPGNYRFSIDELVKEVEDLKRLGVPAVMLFGIPEQKDERGSEGIAENGIIQRAVREIKNSVPEIVVITDVCFCEYTSHGHCGCVLDQQVDNDATLEWLGKMAISHAKAGADVVAPSDMMDGRIGAIRQSLDEQGFHNTPILSYAAKFASAFYGPFRDAADSAPQFGDRRSYQMDPANGDEAIREVALDIEEGADIVMVKPALPYLDIIRRVKDKFQLPTAAYNVSGEFAMVKAAGKMGWIDETRVMMEWLLSIKRAGADLILSYFAKDAARLLS
ncbi:MAG TPA: porphobilinogen synthase [bacterium]|nr:porphobilinogen synthase [bacterium]